MRNLGLVLIGAGGMEAVTQALTLKASPALFMAGCLVAFFGALMVLEDAERKGA